MLSFALTDEQEAYRVELARYARTKLLPAYRDRAASTEFPWDAHKELAALGVLGIGLPEEFGGTGTSPDDPVTLGMITETLAYGDVNVAAAPVQSGLVAAQLGEGGSRAVQERYIPELIAGDAVSGIAVTEPGSGSDAAGMRTVAKPVDGGWLLSGEKIAITHAMCAKTMLIYARHPGSSRSKGISCFLLPMASKGVSVAHMPGMGCLPLGWGSIAMDEVFVPSDHLVGEEGHGFAAAMHHFDFSRSALGLLCLGAARASLDEAARYAQEREAFGQKIGEFQGVSFPLAEHTTYLEAARLLCYRALWARQVDEPHTALAAMSKWWPPQVALDAIQAAMKIHGNLGYSTEFPLQQRYRDVMAYLVADGTSEIQKRIISKDVYRKAQ
ncbi:acyl-CoA dehydrogenase family protein [Pseudonocardia spinosispora]|uniref:acyl-CoA dehydrogenase family protein n=1 Tax=Pseudonocardia spinosispora TaxID=103441 RepID=UPI000411EB8F|nr:acyl-CoA dehydrogenase family protein [Pseudonocardia spinosispora]